MRRGGILGCQRRNDSSRDTELAKLRPIFTVLCGRPRRVTRHVGPFYEPSRGQLNPAITDHQWIVLGCQRAVVAACNFAALEKSKGDRAAVRCPHYIQRCGHTRADI